MTERLYYNDSYTIQFAATILERLVHKDSTAVVLNQSYFYPSSGGQPHDVGTLSDVAVTNVFVRKEDGAVVHVLERDHVPDQISGRIDWERRFDHMQHHCGQHILSRAFIEVAEAPTVSFHLGPESCTIDIDVAEITSEKLKAAETLANQIVQENRPVTTKQVSLEEAQSLPIRKLPPVSDGLIRLVDITNFDLTACGGTHVAHTGEIGLIKVTKIERRKKILRVEFLCGRRALADYDRKITVVQALMANLSTGQDKLVGSVEKLEQERKMLSREVRLLKREKFEQVAQRLSNQLDQLHDIEFLTHTFTNGESLDDMRQIATVLTSSENRVIVLGSAGSQAMLCFASSAGDRFHMGNLLRAVLPLVNAKSGGGGMKQAQGGGQSATAAEVSAALHVAREKIENQEDF
ncbi:MAG: DHHA1 domain-containing protein [Chloroflexota bacterium]